MDGLEEWMVPGGEGDQVFPCLEKLCIEGCGTIKSMLVGGATGGGFETLRGDKTHCFITNIRSLQLT